MLNFCVFIFFIYALAAILKMLFGSVRKGKPIAPTVYNKPDGRKKLSVQTRGRAA